MLALLRVACLASDSTGDGTALTYDETETEAVFIPPSNYTTDSCVLQRGELRLGGSDQVRL